jgi:CheY-like chemotaxis protein
VGVVPQIRFGGKMFHPRNLFSSKLLHARRDFADQAHQLLLTWHRQRVKNGGTGVSRKEFMLQDKKMCGVLVVDDEVLVLKYTTSVIAGLGYQKVMCATSVEAARSVLMVESVSLIISDVSLPDGDGRQLLCEALEQQPHAAAVLITGFSSADIKLPDALRGRALLLQKPFTADDISQVLAELLERPGRPALPAVA